MEEGRDGRSQGRETVSERARCREGGVEVVREGR